MGLPNDIIENNFKDDYEINKTLKKYLNINIESFIFKRKRFKSTNIETNQLFKNKIQTKTEIISRGNEKNNSKKINTKINNKIKVKSLSCEKLEKVPNEIKNLKKDSIYKTYNSQKSNPEIESQSLYKYNKEDIAKENDSSSTIDENSNFTDKENDATISNSTYNQDQLIIHNNIKTIFLNSGISNKDSLFNSNIVKEEKTSSDLSNQESISTIDYELNFYRNGTDIRRSYIQKLVTKALFLPNNKPKTHNSLIIFDWDDTLLPTTFLTPQGIFNEKIIYEEIISRKIEKLEKSVLRLLNIAISKGDVYIITNAGEGWVEYSAKIIYPNILPILNKIKVISARGDWEKDYPGDIKSWKIQAFLSLANKLDVKLVTNIICLGDSMFEMEAGRILGKKFSEAFVKTIKFKEGPKPEELNKQLIVVSNQFNAVYSAIKNLTIRVEKKKK